MANRIIVFLVYALVLFALTPTASAQVRPSDLPRLRISDLQLEGAFRLPSTHFGSSELNFAQGPIEYNPARRSIYIVGHTYQQAIAELPVPHLLMSASVDSLNIAGPPLQVFSQVLPRVSGGNAQNLDRIGGMRLVNGPSGAELLVNAYEYYDAPGDNSQTTFVVRNADDLAHSTINGFFSFLGGAGHTSGWISPVPSEWQTVLGKTHITGQSSGLPIISRLSVGPSAFAFDPATIVGNPSVPNPVPAIKLLDFDLAHPLHADLSNDSRTNDLWTHLSRVTYGFIAPGSRSYVTIGHSGGHRSGVCYKCTQTDGTLCGGYCAPDPTDYSHYYWLWDVNDLVAVKDGRMNASDVRPYEHGIFATPYPSKEIGGGSFDPGSGLLYLTALEADRSQGAYANPPVVIVYRLLSRTDHTPPAAPSGLVVR